MTVSDSLYTIYLYIRVFILELILFLQQRCIYKLLPPSTRESTKSIVIIGDENAFGIGDRLGHTGLLEQLNEQLKRNKSKQDGLKLRWRIVTNGKFNSTSKDWLPGSKLYLNCLKLYKPNVIILLLGSNNQENIDDLIKNYKIIVDSFLDNDIMIISPGLPNYYNENNYHTANIELKNILTDLLNKRKEKYNNQQQQQQQQQQQSICLINGNGDLSKITALGHHAFTKEDNFCSLNSRGYRIFAADLFDDIVTVAKKIEWTYWKGRLSPTTDITSSSQSTSDKTL